MEEQVVSSAQPKEMNWLARIVNVIFEPRKVFENLKARPKWLAPFIVYCLLAVAIAYFFSPIVMSEQIQKIRDSDKYSDVQKEAMIQGMEAVASGPARFFVLLAPLGIIVQFLFVAAALFLTFNIIMAGDSNFKSVLSVVSHSYMVTIPSSIVKVPLVFLKRTMEVHFGPVLLLPVDLKDSFIYSFLKGFDVFTFWQVLVLSLGLGIMYNFSFKKSLFPILLLWVLLILASALLSGVRIFGGV